MRPSTRKAACAAALCLAAAAPSAFAALITWTDWTSAAGSSATGAAGVVGVGYTGEVFANGTVVGSGPNAVNFGAPWIPSGTYSDGAIINNVPINGNMIGLTGGNTLPHTITFSQAVTNPVMAIFSLGSGGNPASFLFSTSSILFVSGGPSAPCCGGGPISVAGNVVSGVEGNGTIEFVGTFTSIAWTNPQLENFYSFTVGIPAAAVPEPGSVALLGLGLLGLGFGRRRAA